MAVSRATFGVSWGPSWAILGYLAATLEPSWAILGPILGPSWAILVPSWPSLRGKFRVTQNLPGQILRNAKFARANFAYREICQCKFCVTQNLLGQILCMGHLGLSWCHVDAILGHFGNTLGYLGAILGPFWASTFPRRSQSRFSKTCVSWMRNACFWNPPILAVSRATFGVSWGPSWAILGYLAATLEPSWAILGPSWAHLGPSWSHLGRVYGAIFV